MSGNEPLSWKPRLLSFREALELHDYESIRRDLIFSKQCFDRIASREYGVISSNLSGADSSTLGDFVDWCVFVAGSIHYRKCFMEDRERVRLTREEIVAILTHDQMGLHQSLYDIASKHVAHSVNEMELGCTTMGVAIDSKGTLHRGGIGYHMTVSGPLGPKGYLAISKIISRIIVEVVEKKISTLKIRVQEVVDGMSDAEIGELPEGFPPNRDDIAYGARRSWPKRKIG